MLLHFRGGDRNIYSAGAKKYLTNLKNHLRLNIIRTLKRINLYAGEVLGIASLTREEGRSIFARVVGWTSPPSIGIQYPMRREADEWCALQRSILRLSPGEFIGDTWLDEDSHLPNILRYFAYSNQTLERIGKKTFNIVPITSIKSHFISIDTSVLWGILKGAGIVSCSLAVFDVLRDDHWRSAFDLSKIVGGSHNFTHLVETDGISICVHQTKMTEASASGTTIRSSDRVIGLDPGKITLMHAAVPLPDGTFKSVEFRRTQYQREAGMYTARRKTETWSDGIRKELAVLSVVSTKGIAIDRMYEYMDAYMDIKEALWCEYTKPRWARQRLRLYGGKKRSYAKFFNRLEDNLHDGRTVIAYGHARPSPGNIRGKYDAPTTRSFKECSLRFPTKTVDEFRTSKVDCETNQILKEVRLQQVQRTVRGLLWCDSTINTRSKFVNRDLNAAINIRRCAVLPQRPPELSRLGHPKLRLAVGKWIKK